MKIVQHNRYLVYSLSSKYFNLSINYVNCRHQIINYVRYKRTEQSERVSQIDTGPRRETLDPRSICSLCSHTGDWPTPRFGAYQATEAKNGTAFASTLDDQNSISVSMTQARSLAVAHHLLDGLESACTSPTYNE